jgi:hypothetical protein
MSDFPQTLIDSAVPRHARRPGTGTARRPRRKALTWLALGAVLKLAVGAVAYAHFADATPAEWRRSEASQPRKPSSHSLSFHPAADEQREAPST